MIDDDECVTILTCSPFVPTEPQTTFAHSNSNYEESRRARYNREVGCTTELDNSNRAESIRARYNREVGCTTELDLPPSSFKMLLSPRLRSLAKANTDLAMHTVQLTTGESHDDCRASPTSSPENPMSSAFKTLMVFYVFYFILVKSLSYVCATKY
jgi:hypothetical protein